MRRASLHNIVSTSRAFFLHTMIMPEPTPFRDERTRRFGLSIERSKPGTAGVVGKVGLVAWIGLLGLGIIAVFASAADRAFRGVLGLLIIGQLTLHTLYGTETFLYSLHFAPFLVILAGIACLSYWGRFALFLALIVIPCAAIENLRDFDRTVEFFRGNQLKPVGGSHVVIGVPNTVERAQDVRRERRRLLASFGSYGVYFWVTDPDTGELTAPTIPISYFQRTRHRRGLPEDGALIPWAQWSAGDVTITTEVCEVAIPSPAGEVFVTAARVHLANTGMSERKPRLFAAIPCHRPRGIPDRPDRCRRSKRCDPRRRSYCDRR